MGIINIINIPEYFVKIDRVVQKLLNLKKYHTEKKKNSYKHSKFYKIFIEMYK